MVQTVNIALERASVSRLPDVDFTNLPFGKVYTDHMFVADYRKGEWTNLRIIPYGRISVSPATPAIHYGQSIFEGMKAHASATGETLVFRPLDNWKRMNISAKRMCMPAIPEEIFVEGLRHLLAIEKSWIPLTEGGSLYIRPFMFSADEYIGIRPSEDFTFMIIMSPAGAYYASPVKVKIETHYTRAVAGGTGFAKAGGNYGGAIYPAKLAQDEGYHQLIWTDGTAHRHIEESGTMNVMFMLDGVLVTPALSDSILAGITRDSVLALARSWGMKVEERKISVDELMDHIRRGTLQEAFGVGTAATIAPIAMIGHEGKDYVIPATGQIFASRIYKALDMIKRGVERDPFGWIMRFN